MHPFFRLTLIHILILTLLLSGCRQPGMPTLFELIPSSHSQIKFNNLITESDSLNVLKFEYIYNGAGVGVGDFNNDGLSDLFFAGNMVSSRLYINSGDFVFKDITALSGTETSVWCTGIAVIDINQDGKLDIHVSTAHPNADKASANLVFLNQGNNADGIPVFKEVASALGLADTSYSTQAAFFDYDLDGDLDVFLLTNALELYNRNTLIGQYRGSGKSKDKLFRNDGISPNGLPVFKDVSIDAGLREEGWGLGIAITDIDRDGYPDVYVANDFQSNDLLYINQKNGSFTNQISNYIRHQSQNSMGMDIADFNNDGLEDIAVVDMMPEDNLRQKTMFPRIEYDRFQSALEKGYQPQYVRNVLQLNNGNNSFSEIGYMAGVFATDWSWSALFADFDNDGFRDLLISNGYRKDVTNLDFVSYRKESTMFGTKDTKEQIILQSVGDLEGIKKPSFVFQNNGDLTFTDKVNDWGLTQPSYSNGVAYADLDNDGDLDLVMNNINDEAFIYKNRLIELHNGEAKVNNANFLRIKLNGNNGNTHGLGAKLTIYYNGKFQFAEHRLQRGYKTTVEPFIHFGLDTIDIIDSVVVIWPKEKKQFLKNVAVNQVLVLDEKEAKLFSHKNPDSPTMFEDESVIITHTRPATEIDYVDFKSQRLLIQKYSQGGPALASGDVNGDSLEDLVVGSPAGNATRIFIQESNGTFILSDSISKMEEDMGVLLFDGDGDDDLDLYCVSGSSEFGNNTEMYQDRYYTNDGKGNFLLDKIALPKIESAGGTVRAADFDKDGDLDLFVGGRIKPEKYPLPPTSYLLRNNGKGKFEDATASVAPGLQYAGMITDALWSDFNNDGSIDLILVGEFMPVKFFKNENGKTFTDIASRQDSIDKSGFWNSINGGDFDNDGDIDYVAGNLGLNSFFKASEDQPLTLYAKDYDQNGSIEPVLTHFNQGKEHIVHYRETLIDQLPMLRKKLKRYDIYGKTAFAELFNSEMLKDTYVLKANYLMSAYIENLGGGEFRYHPLPIHAQVSPMFGMLITDFDSDGNLDIMSVGNSYAAEPLTGWYDAGIGCVLKGNGKGSFTSINVTETGFFVDRDAKSFITVLQPDKQPLVVVSQNQDPIRIFKSKKPNTRPIVRLRPTDTYAEIKLSNGGIRKQEFYFGAGYLSQSSRAMFIPQEATAIAIYSSTGGKRVLSVNVK